MGEKAEDEIMSELERTPIGRTQRQLSEATGYSRKKVRRITDQLQKKNLVKVFELGGAKIHRKNTEEDG